MRAIGKPVYEHPTQREHTKLADDVFSGTKNRVLQLIARIAPGATGLRPLLHRWRGVNIGKNVWIGYDAIIETSYPRLVTIRDGAIISIRVLITAHFGEAPRGVVIEEDAFLGPGVIVLPNVVVGRGAVVAAGSVVTRSVPPMTFVQGNPARPIARCGIPLTPETWKEFSMRLRPLLRKENP
jgi:acetyltransferase-like isoleucine patch superfamily enzyme